MRVLASLRLAALVLLPLCGGCVFTTYRTSPSGEAILQTGRPMAYRAADRAYAFSQRAVVRYQRAAIYPVGFHFFSGWMSPLEPVARLPTLPLELPLSWSSETPFDVVVLARAPHGASVELRPMPYYDLDLSERHGGRIARAFAHPMFDAYRRIFADEIDFTRGDAALHASGADYAPERRYLRTYEYWLADHVPVLAWVGRDGSENLLLRRANGLDHYRDLKLARSLKVDLPYDALFDTLDGENVFILFRGWSENRYFDAIPTSAKGSCIVSVLNLATGERRDFGRFDDTPEAKDLPEGLEIRIERASAR